jgi:aminoglycoside 6'-N-acetyltransferase I
MPRLYAPGIARTSAWTYWSGWGDLEVSNEGLDDDEWGYLVCERRGILMVQSPKVETLGPKIHIRPAVGDDAGQWIGLRAALWPDETGAEHTAAVARFFDEPGMRLGDIPEAVFVAELPGRSAHRLIGFAELSRRPYAEGCTTSPVGFLEGWYVVPEYRRRGVGRKLVAAAEQWARGLGCREFASDTTVENTASAAAHGALGFEEVEIIRCFRKSLGPRRVSSIGATIREARPDGGGASP